MARFVSGWWLDEDEGVDFLIISEKAYFEEAEAMNDDYDQESLEILEPLFEELGIYEVTESTYEITSSKDEVTAALEAHGEFDFAPEFQAFINQPL